jgi:hypothetical protein
MHTDLAPGRMFLAQKGSGQALFIGLAPDHYVVGSEIYGFVEAASRYLKLDGAKAVPGSSGPTQGQIVVLQQASEGDLAGVQAMTYDGTPLVLSPKDVKETGLTSRDIDRQSYPHYFLKEICEAPRSVEQTMQGRLAVVEQAGRLHPHIELDETVIPARLAQAFREAIRHHVAAAVGQGRDLYEIVLDDTFREQVATFERVFKDKLRQDRYATALSIQAASDLTLLLKYMAGRLPSSDFECDFGVKGTPSHILDTFFACMGQIIGELTRPVDAIKHQAKTVTVGTSRLAEKVAGLLFAALGQNGFETGQLSTANGVVLRRLQDVVGAMQGTTLYRIAGLNWLGEPVDTSTIALEQKAGSSALLPSRVESDTRLRGTKRIIVQNGNVFMGKGRRDQRSILVIPIMSTATTLDYLLLLHVAFRPDVALDKTVTALGGNYQPIRHLVEETRFAWHDAYLNRLEMEELFGGSAEKVSEHILAVLRTASAASASDPS